eukprot:9260829-Pyramimonas_sp.AAC.1
MGRSRNLASSVDWPVGRSMRGRWDPRVIPTRRARGERTQGEEPAPGASDHHPPPPLAGQGGKHVTPQSILSSKF